MVWFKLIVCVVIVFLAGRKVAKYGDIIADRTGIGQVWMGIIALSVITSLPEFFTGISAVTLIDSPDLTVGNLIGANAFNLFNLALLDMFYRQGSIMAVASAGHRLSACFSLIFLAIVSGCILLSIHVSTLSLGWIGWYTPVILIFYVFSVRQIFYYEKRNLAMQKPAQYPEELSLKKMYVYFIIAALFIIGAGIWLATIGDEIAAQTGWQQSFVGSLFLAFTTTLPEITVSFTALRLGAFDMAVANLVGSNLFNLTIIGFIDIIYAGGPVLSKISESNLVVAAAVALMTAFFLLALRFRPRRRFPLNWFNLSLVILFLAAAYFSFNSV